jgi:hypothetical protein
VTRSQRLILNDNLKSQNIRNSHELPNQQFDAQLFDYPLIKSWASERYDFTACNSDDNDERCPALQHPVEPDFGRIPPRDDYSTILYHSLVGIDASQLGLLILVRCQNCNKTLKDFSSLK